jgi:hypothetical protein
MPFKKNNPGCPCCQATCLGCPNGAPEYLLLEISGVKGDGSEFWSDEKCELFNGSYVFALNGSWTANCCEYWGTLPCTQDTPDGYSEETLPCDPCWYAPEHVYGLRILICYYPPDHVSYPDSWRVGVYNGPVEFQATGDGPINCLTISELVLTQQILGGCCIWTDATVKVSAL